MSEQWQKLAEWLLVGWIVLVTGYYFAAAYAAQFGQ